MEPEARQAQCLETAGAAEKAEGRTLSSLHQTMWSGRRRAGTIAHARSPDPPAASLMRAHASGWPGHGAGREQGNRTVGSTGKGVEAEPWTAPRPGRRPGATRLLPRVPRARCPARVSAVRSARQGPGRGGPCRAPVALSAIKRIAAAHRRSVADRCVQERCLLPSRRPGNDYRAHARHAAGTEASECPWRTARP